MRQGRCVLLAVALSMAAAFPLQAAPEPSSRLIQAFSESAADYIRLTEPHCAPALVQVYKNFVWQRDAEFIRSLEHMALGAVYKNALEADTHVVYHCYGPPPPPPPPGSPPAPPVDRRATAIRTAQENFTGYAHDLPAFFDGADKAFADMKKARDAVVAAKDT